MRWGDTALGGQCPTCSKCRRVPRLEATAVSAALATQERHPKGLPQASMKYEMEN
ncbi:hypothetical protein LC593_14565 [Nostoc sp. CHAB 5844]|nr:hypothetical protein [Nostoc sp. CHAB 5844]